MRVTVKERESAINRLRELLKPGDTLYTTVKHVSRSGMSRAISVHAIKDNEPMWLDRLIAQALTSVSFNEKHEALRVDGCGMDMGFHVVYSLASVLWPDGWGCIGENCRANDHSNGDRDYTPHMDDSERAGADGTLCNCHRPHWHRDGGYALNQRWM